MSLSSSSSQNFDSDQFSYDLNVHDADKLKIDRVEEQKQKLRAKESRDRTVLLTKQKIHHDLTYLGIDITEGITLQTARQFAKDFFTNENVNLRSQDNQNAVVLLQKLLHLRDLTGNLYVEGNLDNNFKRALEQKIADFLYIFELNHGRNSSEPQSPYMKLKESLTVDNLLKYSASMFRLLTEPESFMFDLELKVLPVSRKIEMLSYRNSNQLLLNSIATDLGYNDIDDLEYKVGEENKIQGLIDSPQATVLLLKSFELTKDPMNFNKVTFLKFRLGLPISYKFAESVLDKVLSENPGKTIDDLYRGSKNLYFKKSVEEIYNFDKLSEEFKLKAAKKALKPFLANGIGIKQINSDKNPFLVKSLEFFFSQYQCAFDTNAYVIGQLNRKLGLTEAQKPILSSKSIAILMQYNLGDQVESSEVPSTDFELSGSSFDFKLVKSQLELVQDHGVPKGKEHFYVPMIQVLLNEALKVIKGFKPLEVDGLMGSRPNTNTKKAIQLFYKTFFKGEKLYYAKDILSPGFIKRLLNYKAKDSLGSNFFDAVSEEKLDTENLNNQNLEFSKSYLRGLLLKTAKGESIKDECYLPYMLNLIQSIKGYEQVTRKNWEKHIAQLIDNFNRNSTVKSAISAKADSIEEEDYKIESFEKHSGRFIAYLINYPNFDKYYDELTKLKVILQARTSKDSSQVVTQSATREVAEEYSSDATKSKSEVPAEQAAREAAQKAAREKAAAEKAAAEKAAADKVAAEKAAREKAAREKAAREAAQKAAREKAAASEEAAREKAAEEDSQDRTDPAVKSVVEEAKASRGKVIQSAVSAIIDDSPYQRSIRSSEESDTIYKAVTTSEMPEYVTRKYIPSKIKSRRVEEIENIGRIADYDIFNSVSEEGLKLDGSYKSVYIGQVLQIYLNEYVKSGKIKNPPLSIDGDIGKGTIRTINSVIYLYNKFVESSKDFALNPINYLDLDTKIIPKDVFTMFASYSGYNTFSTFIGLKEDHVDFSIKFKTQMNDFLDDLKMDKLDLSKFKIESIKKLLYVYVQMKLKESDPGINVDESYTEQKYIDLLKKNNLYNESSPIGLDLDKALSRKIFQDN